MNLRRILQGITLLAALTFCVNDAQAQQAQLAGVNSEGLIQLGSNHPYVVTTYELSIAPLGFSTADEAVAEFKKYSDEGFISFTFDMANQMATMTMNANLVADVQLTVGQMNEKLKMIHTIKR